MENKCPKCGGDKLNCASPPVSNQDPEAKEYACGTIAWSDGGITESGDCRWRAELAAANQRAELAEAQLAEIKEALEFYANPKNWESPSKGFALQYNPEPSPIKKAGGDKVAREALAKASPSVETLLHEIEVGYASVYLLQQIISGAEHV